MSSQSLWKRKFRTVLTILGVVIGVSSIVVMVSLGLGLSRASLETVERFGGLTTINVREAGAYDTSISEKDKKHLTDDLIEILEQNPHVKGAYPILQISAIAKSGVYEGNFQIRGTTPKGLESLKIKLEDGSLPLEADRVTFLYGNQILSNFYNPRNRSGYWYDGVMADIDLKNDPIFVIYDTDAYYSSQSNNQGGAGSEGNTTTKRRAKKYLADYCGLMEGGPDSYNSSSWYVYTNIDALKNLLKKEFRNRAIPDQPLRQNGKPYREIFYSEIAVDVDDMDNMSEVQSWIKDMGYQADSNSEWVESTRQQSGYIQAALGGIGAVSLIVAAIGIMNTMMMSIYERTKEIGVMKVLGCDMGNIGTLFLLEAGYIGFFGGLAGVIISYGVSFIINRFTASMEGFGMESSAGLSYIPPWLAFVGLVFAVFVGIVSGFFPARRAMHLSPLAAIRNE